MRLCIIGHTEKNYLPYIERYIKLFEEKNISFDVIYWQREKMPENVLLNEYHFFKTTTSGVINKVLSYLSYKKFVLSVLKKNKYDKVILLTTLPAIFLNGYLKRHYKNKYLFDFRDYSFEKYPFYKRIVDKIIDNSEFTTISSRGFMEFLSENKKIFVTHNIPVGITRLETIDMSKKEVINIGFVGGVRYYNENVAFINKLKNTDKYKLFYIGKQNDDCNLSEYCSQNGVFNAEFIGKYENSQKPELYKKIDVINSIYGNMSLEVTTALPNRLYEACLLKKPIISSTGTYLGSVIKKYKLGISLDVFSDDVLTLVNEYISGFKINEFQKGCDNFLSEVYEDERKLSQKLTEFCEM